MSAIAIWQAFSEVLTASEVLPLKPCRRTASTRELCPETRVSEIPGVTEVPPPRVASRVWGPLRLTEAPLPRACWVALLKIAL